MFFDIVRWYSEEYDSFYIGGSPNYVLTVSTVGVGDAVDTLNIAGSPANGNAFAMNNAMSCVARLGPWWYTDSNHCCHSRFFGGSGGGFAWGTIDALQVGRMMIREVD